MKTNRDEILESAFQLFMAMNYERVSLQMITKKVGLTKTGIFNYYPTKLQRQAKDSSKEAQQDSDRSIR